MHKSVRRRDESARKALATFRSV
ncbi:unnamed protein product, partial [Rotaria sp. Silwood2]